MRLWHEALLPLLPRQQLLGQHRECCALRGNGWGRRHATVDYVFKHPYVWLAAYHYKVMQEMNKRGYEPSVEWLDVWYRGEKHLKMTANMGDWLIFTEASKKQTPIYPEHDDEYLRECLENLSRKGIKIEMEVK